MNYRYAQAEGEEPYEFSPLPGVPDTVVVLKAIACYEYQSREHPGWKTSEAKRFCDALAAHTLRHLPGWEKAAGWDIDDRLVFLTGLARGTPDRGGRDGLRDGSSVTAALDLTGGRDASLSP